MWYIESLFIHLIDEILWSLTTRIPPLRTHTIQTLETTVLVSVTEFDDTFRFIV